MDMSLDPKALSGLFSMCRDAVLGIEDGRILFLNPAASDLFGAAHGDPAENHIPNYILNDPARQFTATLSVGQRSGCASVSRKDGLTLISIVLPEEESSPSTLLENVAKEFSGALTTSRLAMDILFKSVHAETDEKLQNYTAILYQNFYQMKRLCQHLSAADALKKGTLPFFPKAVAVDRLCGDLCSTLEYFCQSLQITLSYSAEPGHYYTMGDPTLLEIMLLNLLTNSFAHSNPGGRVRMHLSRQGSRIQIAVDDEGSGIAAQSLSQVLTGTHIPPPTDTAAKAGLGLSIARGIAELHGGAILLESREDTGTKLRILLPVQLPEETTVHTPSVPYNNEGMNSILTELSVILDKKFYNKTFFD